MEFVYISALEHQAAVEKYLRASSCLVCRISVCVCVSLSVLVRDKIDKRAAEKEGVDCEFVFGCLSYVIALAFVRIASDSVFAFFFGLLCVCALESCARWGVCMCMRVCLCSMASILYYLACACGIKREDPGKESKGEMIYCILRVWASVFVPMYVFITDMQVFFGACSCPCVRVWANMSIYVMCAYLCVSVCVCADVVCLYMHTHKHTRIQTYTQAYVHK